MNGLIVLACPGPEWPSLVFLIAGTAGLLSLPFVALFVAKSIAEALQTRRAELADASAQRRHRSRFVSEDKG